MTGDFAAHLLAEMLWTAVLVSAPLLGLTLIVGLVISIFQVVTQVQEVSLVFVPKILAAVVALAVFGPWMLRKLVGFAANLIGSIPGYF